MVSTPNFLRNASPHRRYLSRRSSTRSPTSTSPAPSSPKLQAATLTLPSPTNTRKSSYAGTSTPEIGSGVDSGSELGNELFGEMIGESDAQCWQRMLRLQREYHCYNSARLSAAVEAEERGETEVAVRECCAFPNKL
jgi:hypothetical protein